MAIEAVSVVAAKVATEAAREAALQAAREVAQKMATEAGAQSAGSELQTAMMERQSLQEGFRIGEMSETKGEGRELLRQKEADASEELKSKLDNEEIKPEAETNPETETPSPEMNHPPEASEAVEPQESVEIQEAAEQSELAEAQNGMETPQLVEAQEATPIRYDLLTRNQALEGDVHPVTGVPFEQKTVVDAEGNLATGVFPKFESSFDAKLPKDMLKASDKEQFAECNHQLQDSVTKKPDTAKSFSSEQIEQIRNGDTPDGYTWHHNEEVGKMQLVKSDVHGQTGHTGGRSIWGGGGEFRV